MDKKNMDSKKWQPLIEQAVGIINSDNKIDKNEMDELYQLFYVVNYSAKERETILNKIINKEKIDDNVQIPSIKDYNKKERIVYLKEIMKFQKLQKKETQDSKKLVEVLKKAFKISPKTLDFINNLIGKENNLFDIQNWSDENIVDAISNLSALGVPLTALYFFGITGFSGAGILSGLAAIGSLFGTFGISPAIGGIIILITMSKGSREIFKSKIAPKFLNFINDIFKKHSYTKEDIIKVYMGIRNNIEFDINHFKPKIFDVFKKNWHSRKILFHVLRKLYKSYTQRIEKLQKI